MSKRSPELSRPYYISAKSLIEGDLERYLQKSEKVLAEIPIIFVKMGPKGVLVVNREGSSIEAVHVKPERPLTQVVSVTGAGDTLTGSLIAGLAKHRHLTTSDLVRLVRLAMKNAEKTLMSPKAVAENLNVI